MRLVSSFRRAVVAGFALVPLLFLAACKGSSDSSASSINTITVTGTVTYTRVPLLKDANGVPTGLETDSTKFESKPARGILVRFYKSVEETAADGTKVTVWKLAASADSITDATGKYSATVEKDTPVFVEVYSVAGEPLVRLIADPLGMNSPLNQSERPLYLLRKGLDGSAPENNPTPATKATANATVDFTIGIQEKWWIGVPNPTLVTAAVRETQGTGSRVMGILDTLYSFKSVYGRALPGGTLSTTLDLHYRPGVNEARGSYVEFDRTVFPQSFDSNVGSRHFFGSLRGGPSNDDAWDEAVIFTLLGRNTQSSVWTGALMPVAENLTHLAPDLAVAEGMASGMAVNLLKSPYLADTSDAGITVVDVRDRSSLATDQISPFSGPNIAALCWDLILAGSNVAAPGTPSTWANINSSAMPRYFTAALPKNSDGTKFVDVISIYGQVKRLQEAQVTGEPVNLANIFTDAALTPLLSPYGLTWPRPTTGSHASFLLDWGTDPKTSTTPLPALAFSMAKAVKVNGAYPNASESEVAYAQLYMAKDTAYDFSIVTQPAALPAGVSVEAYFPVIGATLTFTNGSAPARLILPGNATTPQLHFVRVRVLSPNQLAPDFLATVQFVPIS